MEGALKKYLKEMDCDEGETLHSFRTGCAITLAATGVPEKQARQHIGWCSNRMPDHYTGASRVLQAGGLSAALASTKAASAVQSFEGTNNFRGLQAAFPLTVSGRKEFGAGTPEAVGGACTQDK
uniref:Uncharacterized protein n=1 Tax=Branchiostoma floridae TaxID=7739 RepID=C3YPC0_BRAFL|eukprot:XP_002601692.1 hypothetical protein BRAFLDRAFT_94572 [Branchiostoma floridae]